MTHSAPSRALGMRSMATPLSPIAAARWPSPTSDTIRPTLRRAGHAAPAAPNGQTRERRIDWEKTRSRWRAGVKNQAGTEAKWHKTTGMVRRSAPRRALEGRGPDDHAGPVIGWKDAAVFGPWAGCGGLPPTRRPPRQARPSCTPDLRHKVRHKCLSACDRSATAAQKPRAAFSRPQLIYFFLGPRR